MTIRQPVAGDLGLVAGLVFACLVASAWVRPLMLPDEGRYVGVAWEMIRSGDWITPTLNGLPFFHKPPLFYWVTAASMSLFGPTELPARAAPILGGWIGAMVLYMFVCRWADGRRAQLALCVLLAQPLFLIGAQFANLDMLVAGCITATVVLSADAALRREAAIPFHRSLAAAYAMAAIGVLAKGLIGAVIPLLVVVGWLAIRRKPRVIVALAWLPGVAIFIGLAAPWFAAMQWRFAGFFDYFFVVQHLKRFTVTGFSNANPVWFFPVLVSLLCLPWLPWLFQLLARGLRRDPQGLPVRLLMLVWVVTVVGFFSVPTGKLVGYMLPAAPPLAYLFADGYASGTKPSTSARRLWWASAAIAVGVSLAIVVALALRPVRSTRELAMALRQSRGAQEPVLMLQYYYFDLPLYARLPEPVRVVDDWEGAKRHPRDDWRHELSDAGRFASERAAATLIDDSSLPRLVCSGPVTWVIGSVMSSSRYPFLAASPIVHSANQTALWRVDPRQPEVAAKIGCAEPGTAHSAHH